MKITLDTATLSRELFKLQGIANTKTTTPITSHALLEAKSDGTLELYATDFDVSLVSRIPCGVERPGVIVVKARDLYEAVKGATSDKVTIEREDNHWAMLRAGAARVRLLGVNPDAYPNRLQAAGVDFISLDTRRLLTMVQKVQFAISNDQGRPNLNGAYLHLTEAKEGSNLCLVATDGHRLSFARQQLSTALDRFPSALRDGIIIPRKGLDELVRSSDATFESIQVGLSGNTVVFQQGESTLFVRLIDGTFPNYRAVIPAEKEERRAIVSRSNFADRIKYISRFSNSKSNSIRVDFSGTVCTLHANDAEKGEGQDEVPITYAGPEVRAGYNAQYLLQALGACTSDEVTVEIVDTVLPTVIRELDESDEGENLFIVMPMRL